MELVRSQNANEIPEFYPHEIFHEATIFEKFWKTVKMLKFSERDQPPALQVIAREPG